MRKRWLPRQRLGLPTSHPSSRCSRTRTPAGRRAGLLSDHDGGGVQVGDRLMYPPAELARGEHLDPERLVFAGNAGNTGNYGGLPGGEGWQRVQRLLDQGEWIEQPDRHRLLWIDEDGKPWARRRAPARDKLARQSSRALAEHGHLLCVVHLDVLVALSGTGSASPGPPYLGAWGCRAPRECHR